MVGVIGIIALLTVLGLSLFITRLATIALTMTGLSRQAASFQARSAFTGTGFTTRESEHIANHPVRRRIIMVLMILRSAGLVTVIISVILSFATAAKESERLARLGWIIGGVVLLLAAGHLPIVSLGLEKLIGWALGRWTDLDVWDYSSLLKLSGDYAVSEMQVRDSDWVEGKELRECDLNEEGVTVLGIERAEGEYVGAPRGSTPIHKGDTLILYGRNEVLEDLDQRRGGGSGDVAHEEAVAKQQQHMHRQDEQERRAEEQRQSEAPDSAEE